MLDSQVLALIVASPPVLEVLTFSLSRSLPTSPLTRWLAPLLLLVVTLAGKWTL